MSIFEYPEVILLILLLVSSFYYWKKISRWNKSSTPTDWPLFGMLPGLVQNAHRVHDFATDLVKEGNGTFEFKGPWFANSDMLVTSDPANIHHVLSKNFSNYPKGPELKEIFEVLGDGIFNADDKLWEIQRKTTMALMNRSTFHNLLEQTTWEKVEKGLLPLLEYFCKQEMEFDLQDIFQRFTFDSITKLLLDHDPESLSIDLPYIPCEKAFNDVVEALLYRHILPPRIWKLLKWLQIGIEKKLSLAWQDFDEFIYRCISIKQEEIQLQKQEDFKLVTGFFKAFDGFSGVTGDSQKFLRDMFLNLMLAGRDTTGTTLTWLFWLLAKNPLAKAKILEEIETKLNLKEESFFSVEESRKLVYLHCALCESLRLYPPVSFTHKASSNSDVLPSGHCIDPNTKVIISFYSIARMETIWGNDCLEFKPERWITERGGIKHEPSFKFPAFNAGPRTCVGKEMAFIQMKMIAASVIYNYNVEVVEGHPVFPSPSIIIQMKHGLKVRVSKRNI